MHLYGTFDEKGYRFESRIPSERGEPHAFELRILVDGQPRHTLLIPAAHPMTFGIDVEDANHLNSVVDRLLELLPPPSEFSAKAIAALDLLEAAIGGKAMRERYARKPDEVSDRADGEFARVGNLLARSLVALFGGRAALDAWMKAERPELGNRTPGEALHLGMVKEVLGLLASFKRAMGPEGD